MAHTAVFLMNLGGPRSLDEVEPYLRELFADPLVVTAPLGPLRPLFARLVSRLRAPSSAEKYGLIGGRSPLVTGTEAQARALQAALGPGFTCHLAMRCGHPSTAEGVAEALAAGAGRALALPLYPQYARATTLSSLLELRRRWPRERGQPVELCTWHDDPGYLDASAAALRETVAAVEPGLRERLLVVFSLAVGTVLEATVGPYQGKQTSELALLRQVLDQFQPGDIVLADRFFCSYWVIAA